MPGCSECRVAADAGLPEKHCRQGGEHCTCQCRVVDGSETPGEVVIIEFNLEPRRALEEKFHDILTNVLDYYRVPEGVVCDLAHDLIDAIEE